VQEKPNVASRKKQAYDSESARTSMARRKLAMIAQLTQIERQRAIAICIAVALGGALIMLGGRDDEIGVHGALIFVAGMLMIFRIGMSYYAPEPSEDRLTPSSARA
jgi:hypothetical protein